MAFAVDGRNEWSPQYYLPPPEDDDQEESGIYLASPGGSELRLVSSDKAWLVSWSPDGADILFITDTVSLIKPDGGGRRSLGDAGATVNAAWSPDSSRIALFSFVDEGLYGWRSGSDYDSAGSIGTIARDGTDRRLLVSWGSHTDWSWIEPGPLLATNPDPVGFQAPCETSVVVPDSESNRDLVRDCEILLSFVETLPPHTFLNWGAGVPIALWEGVTVGGSPPRVKGLRLWHHQLPNAIPPAFGELTKLERLDIRGVGLQGPIPPELGGLAALRVLNLRNNALSGSIPLELGRLTKLEILNLAWNRLSSDIPSELGRLVNLKRLNLSGNRLIGGFPTELTGLANLQELRLSDISLKGGIPAHMKGFPRLQHLDLSYNQLTGNIPPELDSLEALITLNLTGNGLSGSIQHLENLTSLEMLSLAENQLSGAIPSWLGNLANLEWLDLSENQLMGSIPPELGDLTNMERLNLSDNPLTGDIPELWNPNIRWVDVRGTNLNCSGSGLCRWLR